MNIPKPLRLLPLLLSTFAFAQDPPGPPTPRVVSEPLGMTPASPISADGTQMHATDPAGTSLYTVDGQWTFGVVNGASNAVLLGGADTRGRANLLQVDNGGKMYQLATTGIWWLWSGGDASHGWWTQTTAPPTPKPPQPKPEPPTPVGAAHVAVYWDAVTQDSSGAPVSVDHYNLYLGTTPGNYGPPLSVKGTNYEMGSQPPGTYYVTIAAVAVDGTVGDYSPEMAFLVVNPHLMCTNTQATVASDGQTVVLSTSCTMTWPTPGAYKYASCQEFAQSTGQSSCLSPDPENPNAPTPTQQSAIQFHGTADPFSVTVPQPISTPPTSIYQQPPPAPVQPLPQKKSKKHAP
jgi:hypothetical protein